MNHPLTLLLIEDSPLYTRLLEQILQHEPNNPFSLELANTLYNGLRRLNHGGIDVILLDLSLPDSTGLDTLSKVHAKAPHLPVVIFSSLDDEDLTLQAIQEGAQDYLVKGQFNGQLLIRSLRYAIERKRIQEALRESEERYTLAARGSNDGLWDWNLRSYKIHFSPRWCEMLGYTAGEIGQMPDAWFNLVHPDDYPQLRRAIDGHLSGETDHLECEYRMLHKGGTYHWMLCRGLAVRTHDDIPYRMAGSQTDITRRKIAEQRLRHDALHDALTGLPNRNYFLSLLEQMVKRAQRQPQLLFAILFVDLDHFKQVNDTYGHQIGDQLLNAVAYRLEACVRAHDVVARLGGDEFVILLDTIVDAQEANEIGERIQSTLKLPFNLQTKTIQISASIGIRVSDKTYERPEDLLHDADTAMYHAKKNGKSRQEQFEESLQTTIPSFITDLPEVKSDWHSNR